MPKDKRASDEELEDLRAFAESMALAGGERAETFHDIQWALRELQWARKPHSVSAGTTSSNAGCRGGPMAETVREQFAAYAHRAWSGWMKYLFEKGTFQDGSFTIDPGHVSHWKRQLATPYEDLTEDEKASDRAEADRMLEIARAPIATIRMPSDGCKHEYFDEWTCQCGDVEEQRCSECGVSDHDLKLVADAEYRFRCLDADFELLAKKYDDAMWDGFWLMIAVAGALTHVRNELEKRNSVTFKILEEHLPQAQRKDLEDEVKALKERIYTMMLGRQFGCLKVIGRCNNGNWWCRCDCENAVEVPEEHLFVHRRIACGECGPSQMPPPWRLEDELTRRDKVLREAWMLAEKRGYADFIELLEEWA